MSSLRCAIAAVLLSSCVSRVSETKPKVAPVPASFPTTMEVDFSEIEWDRCFPPLVGLFVSHQGAEELVRGVRRAARDCQVKQIALEAERDIAEAKLSAADERAKNYESDHTWALIGKFGLIGIGVAAVIGGVVGVYSVVKGK